MWSKIILHYEIVKSCVFFFTWNRLMKCAFFSIKQELFYLPTKDTKIISSPDFGQEK